MIIINKTSNVNVLEWANLAVERSPQSWAHRKSMLYLNKMNAVDWASAQAFLRTAPKGLKWIASWPMPVATAVNNWHPDVFNDTSGKTMMRFLNSEAGEPYRVRN